MQKLLDPTYMSFPFRVEDGGVRTCHRERHVVEQIEQVLFTNPLERLYRPYFGAGVRNLAFEPNSSQIKEMTRKRLLPSLKEALLGEVDPKTLELEIESIEEKLIITISYKLATINRHESHKFELERGIRG